MEKLLQNKHNKFLVKTERHNISPPTFRTKLNAKIKTPMVDYTGREGCLRKLRSWFGWSCIKALILRKSCRESLHQFAICAWRRENLLDRMLPHCLFSCSAWFSLFQVLDLAACLPKKIDRWLMKNLGGMSFKGKAKFLWNSAVGLFCGWIK